MIRCPRKHYSVDSKFLLNSALRWLSSSDIVHFKRSVRVDRILVRTSSNVALRLFLDNSKFDDLPTRPVLSAASSSTLKRNSHKRSNISVCHFPDVLELIVRVFH